LSNNRLTKACNIDEIMENECVDVKITENKKQESVFAVKKNGGYFVYLNSCPHIGTPLNLIPNKFLSHNKNHIICSTHGALFEIETGFCIAGPCINKSLVKIPATIKDNALFIKIP
jgi:nitrite reductase/ring-hydroxylating ferredoxin subunit